MGRAGPVSLQEMTAGIHQNREATQKIVSAQGIQESLVKLETNVELLEIQIQLLITRFVSKFVSLTHPGTLN